MRTLRNRGHRGSEAGLRNPSAEAGDYAETSPPAIIGESSSLARASVTTARWTKPSGEVRAYDARTGVLRWSFDPVVQDERDPMWKTWRGPNAHTTGAGNVWSVIAVDAVRGLVILPTTSPSPDYYGGSRIGDDRYASSVVALAREDGKARLAFQTVHHDLWDYDNASPPALVTIRKDGRARDVVIQATKSGQLFVLDRDTGKPVFPVEERPVPASDVPATRRRRPSPSTRCCLHSRPRESPTRTSGATATARSPNAAAGEGSAKRWRLHAARAAWNGAATVERRRRRVGRCRVRSLIEHRHRAGEPDRGNGAAHRHRRVPPAPPHRNELSARIRIHENAWDAIRHAATAAAGERHGAMHETAIWHSGGHQSLYWRHDVGETTRRLARR